MASNTARHFAKALGLPEAMTDIWPAGRLAPSRRLERRCHRTQHDQEVSGLSVFGLLPARPPKRMLLHLVEGLLRWRERDVLHENDLALVILHHVVTVQAVSVLIVAVGAFYPLVSADAEDRLSQGVRLCTVGALDGAGEDIHRVVRPA